MAAVQLMSAVVGCSGLVKAAGGVKSFADAQALVQAGAARLGTSSGVALVTDPAGSVCSAPGY